MKNLLRATALFLVLACLTAAIAQAAHAGKAVSTPSPGPFTVEKVFDGDTIKLENGEKVRLLGIDAPELHHPELPVQRFAQEATDYMAKQVLGKKVTLEYEPDNLRDIYGRLLAYVYVDGKMLNAELVRLGYAFAYTKGSTHRLVEFLALEKEARSRQMGVWNFSIRDGRMADIIQRYGSLSLDGRAKFDKMLDDLIKADSAVKENVPAATAQPAQKIEWLDAGKHIGETVVLKGTISHTHNSGKACFLNFSQDYRKTVTLVIFAKNFATFPQNPERYYNGKNVTATGKITEHGGRPEIIIEDAQAIETR